MIHAVVCGSSVAPTVVDDHSTRFFAKCIYNTDTEIMLSLFDAEVSRQSYKCWCSEFWLSLPTCRHYVFDDLLFTVA